MVQHNAAPVALDANAMSKAQFGVVVSLLVVLAAEQAIPILMPARMQPRYEYRVEAPKDEQLIDELDNMGYGGWEVVSARRATGEGKGASYEMILRRPI